MTATQVAPTPIDERRLEAIVGQAMTDLAGAYGGVMLTIGHRLGLYSAMRDAGRLTAGDVAARAGCHERYVREWLNSQAAGGYVNYDAGSARYELTAEQALVLADESSPVFFAPAWQIPQVMFLEQDQTIDAFRTGRGIPWGDHRAQLHEGVATFYRGGYRASLVSQWLPALTGVIERLEEGVLVADIGCGYGHSTILMAQAFPMSTFRGFDTDPGSIATGRRNAREAGVEDRVSFELLDARALRGRDYGLICYFDCVHDMGNPVAALQQAYEALAPAGTVMLVEPFAGDRVEDNLTTVGRLYYGGSTLLCLPHAVSEGGPLTLGAQAGEAAIRAVVGAAGFTRFRRAAETPINLVFEARK